MIVKTSHRIWFFTSNIPCFEFALSFLLLGLLLTLLLRWELYMLWDSNMNRRPNMHRPQTLTAVSSWSVGMPLLPDSADPVDAVGWNVFALLALTPPPCLVLSLRRCRVLWITPPKLDASLGMGVVTSSVLCFRCMCFSNRSSLAYMRGHLVHLW